MSESNGLNNPDTDDVSTLIPLANSLAGRRVQWAQLWSVYLQAIGGTGRVALLAGEPGVGKSRLLNELAAQSEKVGAVVLRGSASNGEHMPEYLPFLEALGRSFRLISDRELQHLVGGSASILLDLFPDLETRLQQGALTNTPKDQVRFRLHEAIGGYLIALATKSPVVMILDDLQWADAASLDLLQALAAWQQTAALSIVGSYRSDELERNPALDRILVDLNRERRLAVIAIPALDIEELADLVLYRIGAPLNAAGLTFLQELSEGNPFFAEELLRAWAEDGSLSQTSAGWVLRTEHANSFPDGISGAIRRRLDGIDSATLTLLRVAAVYGRTFSTDVLASAASADLEAIEGQLEGASRRLLVSLDGRGHGTFTHRLIREYLYRELTPAGRRRLHAAIGEALEAKWKIEPEQSLTELVSHLELGEAGSRGVYYARLAADRALRSFAPTDALRFLENALAMSELDSPRRGDLLLSSVEAAILAGSEDTIEAACAAARAWFSSVQDPLGVARIDRLRTHADGGRVVLATAHQELEAVFEAVGADSRVAATAVGRRYFQRAWLAIMEGAWEDAARTLGMGPPFAIPFGGEPLSTLSRLPRGFTAFQQGRYVEAIDEWQRATSSMSFPEEVLTPLQLSLYSMLSLGLAKLGRVDEAHRYRNELLAKSKGLAAPAPFAKSALTLVVLSFLHMDEPDPIQDRYSSLLEMRGEIHWVLVDRVLGLLDLARHDWPAAHNHLISAEATARDEGFRPELAYTLLARAKLEFARGGRGSTLRGHGLMQDAKVLFAELGMTGAQAEAESGFGTLGATNESHGLSAREANVLRLVAAGHSNRRIAVALSLSEKTVANHMTNIFNKIGVSNRAGAAGFAHREGIV
jgi:DNA-binding CsgD family transcriptional regulator/tetratricopeptide (TPR) repeat protein